METIYEMLLRHESLKRKPYRDTEGKLTIGIGRNLDDRGISDQEAFVMFNNDVNRVRKALDKYLPWWRESPEPVRVVLQNMGFQMEVAGLLRFKRFLGALQRSRYSEAAKEMLDSLWATQTPRRAEELAALVAAAVVP